MTVNAEVRDFQKLHRIIAGIVCTNAVLLLLLVASIILSVFVSKYFIALTLVALILLVIGLAVSSSVAVKGYKKTWKTELFEVSAEGESLCCQGKKLHVNLGAKNDVIYVHDLGDDGNPYKASVYMTVFGEDKDRLMEFIRENEIVIEEEKVPEGKGKYGAVTDMNLSVRKYRRR